jgi:hypothetical protein
VDVKINETNIFFLCNTNKLKIFDLRTLVIVKEIIVKADQIELVTNSVSNSIIVFDSATQNMVRYMQCGGFERLDAHNLQLQQRKIDITGFKLVCGCPKLYSLYNSKFSSWITLLFFKSDFVFYYVLRNFNYLIMSSFSILIRISNNLLP